MTFRRPSHHTLSDSIRLVAPPGKVWNLITTVARITEWYDAWDAVEHAADEQRLRVGTTFRLIRHRIGRDETALCRVTSVEAPRRLCWLQHSPRLPIMSIEFDLVPAAETTTLLNHTRTWSKRSH
ncbi:SRPBCC domain-containing protein [Mycobacterium sp. 852002-51057_SCH5723018]|uniref:SRPBCC family protein n=1 Tax=Mycobacterium sp. 852002-51057_SCH5723018 TaxID=1834094 RepID=UPI0007FF6D47|nr:SRPBCC domain-containing protein [Mycobacterium sp. 852002-51057_SCH5723018]OBG20123.1 hypothetical protein A5764_15615 [Mycobacterium sp. 852002-51057_SCH5723018]